MRLAGVHVPCTRAKNVFERRVCVPYQFGPWTLAQVQAQIAPSTQPGTARELEVVRPSERRIISVMLLNPQFHEQRVNQRLSFLASALICGDGFILSKQWDDHLGSWAASPFTKQDWDALLRHLKAMATPDTPFFDCEPCAKSVTGLFRQFSPTVDI